MKTPLLLLALLSSCGPLASSVLEPLAAADAGLPVQAVTGQPPPDGGGPVPEPADGGLAEQTGLPCEVRAVLETHCTGCHGGQSYARHLLSRAEFLEQRLPGQRVGDYALLRMQPGATAPMPPVGYQTSPSAAEVAVISAWVSEGMPGGACGEALAR